MCNANDCVCVPNSQHFQGLKHNLHIWKKMKSGAVLRWGRGTRTPDSLVPQIQKVADRSGVISEVQKCSKIQIFRRTASDPQTT